MNEKIQQIETLLGHKVYVGKVTFDDTIWACVDDDRIQCRHQCPATTADHAVNSLFEEVMK